MKKKNKTEILISDEGIIEHKDVFGITITIASMIMTVVLFVLGVLAIYNA